MTKFYNTLYYDIVACMLFSKCLSNWHRIGIEGVPAIEKVWCLVIESNIGERQVPEFSTQC
jgi:hypothetical protein